MAWHAVSSKGSFIIWKNSGVGLDYSSPLTLSSLSPSLNFGFSFPSLAHGVNVQAYYYFDFLPGLIL
jgi:hypothetical protein